MTANGYRGPGFPPLPSGLLSVRSPSRWFARSPSPSSLSISSTINNGILLGLYFGRIASPAERLIRSFHPPVVLAREVPAIIIIVFHSIVACHRERCSLGVSTHTGDLAKPFITSPRIPHPIIFLLQVIYHWISTQLFTLVHGIHTMCTQNKTDSKRELMSDGKETGEKLPEPTPTMANLTT